MTTARDEQLLQLRLDGQLGPDEAAELQQRLEDSGDVRQRASELDALVTLLDELEVGGPPPDLTREVMAGIGPRRLTGIRKHRKRTQAEGALSMKMSKSVMWGLAAAATVVLGVLVFQDFPPVDNTQGAIGAAKRYDGQQMTQDDVKLGDTSVQAFLQSDVFARIMKDPAAVKLLSDASLRAALASPELSKALADPGLIAALTAPELRMKLADPALVAALTSPELRAMISHTDLMAALSSSELRAAIADPSLAAALTNPELRKAIADPNLVAALAKPELRAMLTDPGLVAALASPQIRMALAHPGLMAALAQPELRMAITSAEFAKALANPDLAKALSDASLSAALKSPAFSQALSQAQELRGSVK